MKSRTVKIWAIVFALCAGIRVQAQFVQTNPLEWLALAEGNEAINSLLQQLCGLKTVSVHSGDRTTPQLDIIGMGINDDLVTVIRGRVELNKRRKGIYEITNR